VLAVALATSSVPLAGTLVHADEKGEKEKEKTIKLGCIGITSNNLGGGAPPLDDVSPKIEQILVEQGIDDMLARWMDTLRGQAHIEKMISGGSESHEARP